MKKILYLVIFTIPAFLCSSEKPKPLIMQVKPSDVVPKTIEIQRKRAESDPNFIRVNSQSRGSDIFVMEENASNFFSRNNSKDGKK